MNPAALQALFEYIDCRIQQAQENPETDIQWQGPTERCAFWKQEVIDALWGE